MKQVLQNWRTGRLEVTDVPAPALASCEVLVRTTCSLVSAGTERAVMQLAEKSIVGKARARPDLVRKVLDKAKREGPIAAARAAWARMDQPIPLGYSSAGVVSEVGQGVEGFVAGDQVACAGAGVANHAEWNAVPLPLLARAPSGVSAESAAFVTLGAVALHGARLLELTLGERVLVIGAGLIGQLAAQIVRASGCTAYVIDSDTSRVEIAVGLGALRGPAEGVDAVLLCASGDSNEPLEMAAQAARDRARIVAVGASKLDVPRRLFYDKELSLRVSRAYGPGRYDLDYEEGRTEYPIGYVRWTLGRNLDSFLSLVAAGHVRTEPLVSHRFPIDRAEEAYALLRDGAEPFLGVLLTYPGTEKKPTRSVGHRVGAPVGRDRIGVAVVGAGAFASSVLVPAVAAQRRAELRTIVSARGVSARHLGTKHGFHSSSTSLDEALADPGTDAVFISTRHELHARQTIQALAAGKDVFVEKPLAISHEELERVLEAHRTSGRRLMVGYNRRFSPLAARARDHFGRREGPLMIDYRVAVSPLPPRSWIRDPLRGGGRLIGEVCHFVDLICFVCGSLPEVVAATAPRGSADEDVVLTLRMADGSLGTIMYETVGDPALSKERLEIHGAGLSAVLDDWRGLELWRDGRRKRVLGLSQRKGHAEEVEAFLSSIHGGLPSPISPAELEAVSLATFAARSSIASGESVRLGSAGERPAAE